VKIPNSFYFSFRLKNSLWAFASGAFVGYLFLLFLPQDRYIPGEYILGIILTGGVTGAIIYQFFLPKYFFGKRRGEFEYIYRQTLIDGRIKKVIDSLTFTFSDEKSVLNLAPTVVIPLLLKKIEIESDPERKFDFFMSMAWATAKEDQHQKAIEYLQEAIALKRDDLVASVRLGVSWERLGKGEEAIHAYETALQEPSLDSQPLRDFVSEQIERVKADGPQKGTPYRFLKYMGI
jgi:hypothetical protein